MKRVFKSFIFIAIFFTMIYAKTVSASTCGGHIELDDFQIISADESTTIKMFETGSNVLYNWTLNYDFQSEEPEINKVELVFQRLGTNPTNYTVEASAFRSFNLGEIPLGDYKLYMIIISSNHTEDNATHSHKTYVVNNDTEINDAFIQQYVETSVDNYFQSYDFSENYITIKPIPPTIAYTTHVQYVGWQNYVRNGEMAGTSGKGLRLEAITIKLTGEVANHYDIYYRVHAQQFGWLGWAKNGENSGTAGYAYRLEGIEIQIVEKGNTPNNYDSSKVAYKDKDAGKKISYTTHVQNIGWQDYVSDGTMAGTSGKSLRLEGIKIKLMNNIYNGSVEYTTHVQNIGWQDYVKDNQMAGTSGKSLRLEGIRIRLTGDVSNYYDVYYRVHAQQFGWLGWAKNGEDAGTAGYAYRLEGINIKLVPKGENFSEYGKTVPFKEKK